MKTEVGSEVYDHVCSYCSVRSHLFLSVESMAGVPFKGAAIVCVLHMECHVGLDRVL